MMNPFLDYLTTHADDMLNDLKALVEHQSPTQDKALVDACGAFLCELFARHLKVQPERFAQTKAGDHLLFKIGQGNRRTLLLTHFDTVWDLDRLGTRIEDGKYYGPGAFDMKGGVIQGIWALKALIAGKALDNHEVWFLCTSDEETGSWHSRPLIEEIAGQCDQVLVLEPSEEGTGNLKIARKGTGHFHMQIKGKAAHAGNNPLGGVSAAEEMARQILRLHELQDLSRGTTVNVGIAQAGNRINVIPDHASLSIDVRVTSLDEAERVEAEICACPVFLDGAQIEVSGGLNRPPMELNARNKSMFEQAVRAGTALGMTVAGSAVGGGSDGNFTSALGIPTLDGLGAEGGGPHAEYEHVAIAGLPRRAALISQIIANS
ncbi:M20 family metallopeptidase [Brucella pseudogrignonensis]|jgi:glutamate carboxypeptidase|uniref:M20 family metallopeptidase n=2 Tax=Brucella pseudogrignonensis TaxID=419475 RepID=UPI00034C365C|nr:M20 family metallopeptidase [Brucella pseudogrignonensis]